MGFCAGNNAPGYAQTGSGWGMGRGFSRGGGGRGWRNGFYATGQPGWMRFNPNYAGQPAVTPMADLEIGMLHQQMQALQEQMDKIQQHLETLSAKPKEE